MLFGGLSLGFPRAGAITFAIEKYPSNAAGVSSSLSSSAQVLAFISVPLATSINDNFGLIYYGMAMAAALFIYGLANLILVIKARQSFEVVQTSSSQSASQVEKDGDIEMKEVSVDKDIDSQSESSK